MLQPGLDDRHREENGEIGRKHGTTLVASLQRKYGAHAPDCPAEAKLSDVLHRLDEQSLTTLVHDLRKQRYVLAASK
jgi:hypothetical protein